MSEYICRQCGYRKTVGYEYENMMEVPVYPMYDANIMGSFLSMEYSGANCEEACPGCGKFGTWELAD